MSIQQQAIIKNNYLNARFKYAVFFLMYVCGLCRVYAPLDCKVTLPDCPQHETFLGAIGECKVNQKEGMATLRPLFLQLNEYGEYPRMDYYFLYPLLHYSRTPTYESYKLLFNLISVNRCLDCNIQGCDSGFTIFPFIFIHESQTPGASYRGIFPIGGSVKGIFGLQEFGWFMFPLYAKVDHGSYQKIFMPWPFIQFQQGPGSKGFGIWPLFGNFYKENDFWYKYHFWPLIYERMDGLGTDNPVYKRGFLPFYAMESSNTMESFTFVYPFFGYTYKTDPISWEHRYLWPFIVHGHSENGDYVHRLAPFYSESFQNGKFNRWVLWPLINCKAWKTEDLEIVMGRVLFGLFYQEIQRSHKDPCFRAEKTHLWPLYSMWDNGNGRRQLQMLSPLEPLFPNNKVIRQLYSPLFALYRYDACEGEYVEHNFLMNLISQRTSCECTQLNIGGGIFSYKKAYGEYMKVELLKGLISYKKNLETCESSIKLFDFDCNKPYCRPKIKRKYPSNF